jgi:phage terminase Nu1 subunit (DNA packaging protein)
MEMLAPEGLPTEFTAAQLRWLLNISNSRLEQLEQAGIIVRTERGRYESAAIRRYVAFLRKAGEGPKNWQAARVALTREKIALLRLDRLERQGKLVPTDQMIAANTTIARTVMTRLLAVPTAIAARLLNLRSPAQAEAVVRPAIEQALEELANLKVVAAGGRKRSELGGHRGHNGAAAPAEEDEI